MKLDGFILKNVNLEETIDDIYVSFYSEKEDASIFIGATLEPYEMKLEVDVFTMQESFWENYFVFEEGIEKVKAILETDSKMTLRQAIVAVFGHFYISVEIDGDEIELKNNLDEEFEECMYSMLEALV